MINTLDQLKNLYPLRKAKEYEEIIALDIETSSNGELLDIGLYYRERNRAVIKYIENKDWRKKAIESPWKTFFEWLWKREGKIRVIAHNGWGFDYIGFAQWLLEHYRDYDLWDTQIQMLSSESLMVGMILKRSQGDITFVDTMRFFPGQSLDRLATDFLGEGKIDVEDEYKQAMELFKKDHREKYYQYLERDCSLLYRIYTEFREGINSFEEIGELGLSSGSTAMRSFRTWMSRNDFFIYACPPEFLGSANLAMRGGLTLYIGDGTKRDGTYENVNHYDVVSMYPSVMRQVPVPTAPLRELGPRENPKLQDKRFRPGWYLVDFEQTQGRVPILYGIHSDDPVWKGQGILSNFDLDFLERFGKINDIADGVVYEDWCYPFEEFLNRLLELRLDAKAKGETAKALAYKIVLNSLYGKFSQQAVREQLAITSNFDWYESEIAAQLNLHGQSEFLEYMRNDGTILYGVESYSTSFSNRFIGAMVTSLARLKLGCVYNLVPTIYCDTDSIFTQEELPRWLAGKRPGDFEVCDDSPASMLCVGKKSYAYGDAVTWKGIPKNKLSVEDVKRIEQGETVRVEYRTPTAFKTALKKKLARPNEFTPKTRKARSSKSFKEQGILREKANFFVEKKVKDFLDLLFVS